MTNTTAIYPGSFDPVTVGHLDIINRASKMFSKVIVVVLNNKDKTPLFTPEERCELINKSVNNLDNIKVDYYDGLLADYCKMHSAGIIVKGLRAMSDFEYEFQMALTNKKLNPDVETVFLTTSAENMYLSSSMVKQIGSMNGDISSFIPEEISDIVKNRLKKG